MATAPPTSSFSAGQAGLALQGIGAIVGVMSAYGSVQAAKRSLRFQAQMAEINGKMAEQGAQSILMAGQRNEQRSSIATANLKSTQTANFAANGIDLGEGSAARTLTSTDVLGEIDKNTIHANAVREAWGYRANAVNANNDALMKRSQADGMSGGAAAFTSLLNSASSVAQNWYQLDKAGALNNGTAPVYKDAPMPLESANNYWGH